MFMINSLIDSPVTWPLADVTTVCWQSPRLWADPVYATGKQFRRHTYIFNNCVSPNGVPLRAVGDVRRSIPVVD